MIPFRFLVLALFYLTACNTAQEKKSLTELQTKIAAVMATMHEPQMGIAARTAKGDYISEYFKEAAADFIKNAARMSEIKHPDKKFRKMNQEMLDALKPFEDASKLGDIPAIKKHWKALAQTCTKCHFYYSKTSKVSFSINLQD